MPPYGTGVHLTCGLALQGIAGQAAGQVASLPALDQGAHGPFFNEVADELANLGRSSSRRVNVNPPWKFIKRKLHERLRAAWSARTAERTCRQTRLILPGTEGKFAKFLFKCTRLELSKLVQFIMGHGFVKYHLFNTGHTDDKSCRKCRGEKGVLLALASQVPSLG